MIFAKMFETVNSQFVLMKTFFVGSEVRETWCGKLHAYGLVVLTVTWRCLRGKKNQKYCLYVKCSHGL